MAMFSAEAERLVQQGIEATRSGQKDTARALLREATRLEPRFEQAWLWLSGLETSQSEQIAALKKVLEINPQSDAAKRGLAKLQPPELDLAAVAASYAAPAPARAAKTEEYSLPPLRPLPAALPAHPQSSVPPIPETPQDVAATYNVDDIGTQSSDRAVGMDSFDSLRPAIQRAGKRKFTLLPRPSELIILAVLFIFIASGWTFFGSYLDKAALNLDSANVMTQPNTSVASEPSQNTAEQLGVENQPQTPATAVPQTAFTYRSQSYVLQVQGTTIDREAFKVVIDVQVSNPLNQPLTVGQTDFTLRAANNDPLQFDAAASTLFAQGSSLAPQGSLQGTLVFVGDINRAPFQLTWQPTKGSVNQVITVR